MEKSVKDPRADAVFENIKLDTSALSPAEILSKRRANAIGGAEKRTGELYGILPEIRAIDAKLSRTVWEMYASFSTGGDPDAVAEDAAALHKKRAAALLRNGFPEDYDTPVFYCQTCRDTGFVKLKKCGCLKALEAAAALNRSSLGKGLQNRTFDTFSLDYCTDPSMRDVLEHCRMYAENFSLESGNLFLFGGTGLGKTHLAAAIAHVAAAKGRHAVYESSFALISDIRKASFTDETTAADKYYQCDLLIIDDLGAEVRSDFSLSVLTGLVDRRIVAGLPTIISTNLDLQSIKKEYGSRLFSRFLGEFKALRFAGKDVRMIKIQ